MAYVISRNLAGGQPISAVSTTQKHGLLETVKAKDSSYGEGDFIYAKASAAITTGSFVSIDYATGFAQVVTDALAKASVGIIAKAEGTFAADEWGWFMRQGTGLGRIKPATEGNTALYVNASAGVLGGTTLSNMVVGAVAVTSVTTTVGSVTCHINFPFISRAESLLGQ